MDYDEAKTLAQQLAPFRGVQAARSGPGNPTGANGKRNARDHADSSPVNAADYVAELAGSEFMQGYEEGQKVRSRGEDRFRRFARLRRDAPDIADKFLAGEFVRRFKNGTVQADMVAAEVAAGIRKEGSPARVRDGFAYCKKLTDKLNASQLKELQAHINHLLEVKQ